MIICVNIDQNKKQNKKKFLRTPLKTSCGPSKFGDQRPKSWQWKNCKGPQIFDVRGPQIFDVRGPQIFDVRGPNGP